MPAVFKRLRICNLTFLTMIYCQVVSSITTDQKTEEGAIEAENQLDSEYLDEVDYNSSGIGEFLGSKCTGECNTRLLNVYCDPVTERCLCDQTFTVRLGATKGCAKPVKLGDQCFFAQTCVDPYAACIQVQHNAICQCKPGYHSVALHKPTEKVFCSEDLLVISTDVGSLLGVASGVALFSALICFVLKLFVGTRPRNYATTHLAQPIIYAKDRGIILGLHAQARPSYKSSRSSSQRSVNTFSRHGSRGVLVSSSRAGAARAAAIRLLISCHINAPKNVNGSRRPSLNSVQSNASSSRSMSYSMMRFEREKELKTEREARRKEAAVPSPMRSTEKLLSDSNQNSPEVWSNKLSPGIVPVITENNNIELTRASTSNSPPLTEPHRSESKTVNQT